MFWNRTNNKTINITPSLVGAAPASHTHTKSQITDFPASLKNPYAITFAGATTGTYDGSRAVTITIPTKYSTTNSLIVTLNGGTQEGTNKFTFDGSTEKTINISPNTIGAAASSHTHNVSNITGLTAGRAVISDANGHPSVSAVTATELSYLDGVTSSVQTQLNNKAAVGHTHNYAGSSSAGGAANSVANSLVVKLNGGSTEGTNMFTFNGSAAKSINITPSAIGAAAASHGTHVTYGTSAPLANGTASAGTAASVSRSDHVHPLPTTISGNAGSATKLATARARITIKFTVTNTAANPTLNVNGTGAKSIRYRGSAISAGYLAANRVYTFVYDGTDYELVGDINTDTNTTYSTGTATTAGLTRLYTSTGQNTNGTMTQKAITDAINSASSTAKVNVPVGTVLFATSTSASFFSSCFGGTWVIDGNVEAIAGSSNITLYMFRKTAA